MGDEIAEVSHPRGRRPPGRGGRGGGFGGGFGGGKDRDDFNRAQRTDVSVFLIPLLDFIF